MFTFNSCSTCPKSWPFTMFKKEAVPLLTFFLTAFFIFFNHVEEEEIVVVKEGIPENYFNKWTLIHFNWCITYTLASPLEKLGDLFFHVNPLRLVNFTAKKIACLSSKAVSGITGLFSKEEVVIVEPPKCDYEFFLYGFLVVLAIIKFFPRIKSFFKF